MIARRDVSPSTLLLSTEILRALGSGGDQARSLLERGDWEGLVHLETNGGSSPEEYLATELLSKFPFNYGVDRKKVAIDSFLDSEGGLSRVPQSLSKALQDGFTHPELHWVFHSARRKIERCLGDFDTEELSACYGFGPGATFDVKRRVAHRSNKYGHERPSVTPNCLDLAVAALRGNGVWIDHLTSVNGQDPLRWFTCVPGNKVVTVPKNSKTDRTIAIEPTMNMFVQKGIGRMMRKRLKYRGVDLDDQTRNQRLALQASLSGKLATVDLKSASDTVSWYVVQELLPPAWVSALEQSRSPYGVLPSGELLLYHKVSSMGNGYTFELESLIFWALLESVVDYLRLEDRTIGVYGDDLVVSVEAVPLLFSVLSGLGFTPNLKKSHWTGDFRESCGKHYSSGSDVSPFYIRENVDSSDRLILLANLIRNYAFHRLGSCWGCDGRFEAVWDLVFHLVPPKHRVLGPLWLNRNQLSDLSIGVNFDEAVPAKARNGYEGFSARGLLRRTSRKRVSNQIGALIYFLDTSGRDPWKHGGETSYEIITSRFKVGNYLVPQWQDVGPWIHQGR